MELKGFRALDPDGYLKKYELLYQGENGTKRYEIVSRHSYGEVSEIGREVDGVSMVVFRGKKLLLLHEFRLGIARNIYNLCAGMALPGESVEDLCKRELQEETGLELTKILTVLPPSFAAVAISDVKTRIAFVRAKGEPRASGEETEPITSRFYTKKQVKKLLQTEEFSSRAQMMAYFFSEGLFEGLFS